MLLISKFSIMKKSVLTAIFVLVIQSLSSQVYNIKVTDAGIMKAEYNVTLTIKNDTIFMKFHESSFTPEVLQKYSITKVDGNNYFVGGDYGNFTIIIAKNNNNKMIQVKYLDLKGKKHKYYYSYRIVFMGSILLATKME